MRKEKVEIVKLIFELTDKQLRWFTEQLPDILTEEERKLLSSKILQKEIYKND